MSDPSAVPYDHGFYAAQADGSRRSVDVILPLAFELATPRSVIDVGCGVGTWLAAAVSLGLSDVSGLDGAYAKDAGLRIDPTLFTAVDLTESIPPMGRRFDLAISLEFAEHLPSTRAAGFVADLCGLADVILFSAAIPGQLGTDHITLELQHVWADRFAGHGYRTFDIIRPHIWHDAEVEPFYRQNVLVYVNETRPDLVDQARTLADACPPLLDAVHPDLLAFWLRRATRPVSTAQAIRQVGSSAGQAVGRRINRWTGRR